MRCSIILLVIVIDRPTYIFVVKSNNEKKIKSKKVMSLENSKFVGLQCGQWFVNSYIVT